MSGNASPLPPAFKQSAPLPPAFQAPREPSEAPSEWARAVLPDNREVLDQRTDAAAGASPSTLGVWRTSSSRLEKKALPKLALLLGALMGIIGYYASNMAGAGPATRLAVLAAAFGIGTVAFYFGLGLAMRKQLTGQGALSVMYLPLPLSTPEAAGRLVAYAAAATGRTVKGPSKIRQVYYWDLDVPVRFYFNPMFGAGKTFLSIKTGTRDHADLFRRLKGHILMHVAPPPPP